MKSIPKIKEERELREKGYKNIAGLDEVGRGCEKPDAEILTSNGWKPYSDINLKQDKVLSYTNDGYIRWQKIEKVIEKDFKGNLIELKNRGINIVITPDHYFTVIRRVSKRDKKENNRLKLIGYKTRKERKIVADLSSNDFIPRGGKWKGINKKFFKLPKVDGNEEKLIDIKLWVAFLGIFVSEGSTTYDKKKGSYKIVISQNENSPHYKKIYSLLKKLPFRFSKFKMGFICCNKQFYTYLKQFGTRYNKFIPKEIKVLPPPLLNILINWMILGDGTCYTGKNRKKVCVYYTVSKRLKNDFEEVLLKADWTYHTSVRIPRKRDMGGRIIEKENQVPCFEILLRRNNKAQIKFLHKKEVFYKGKVFCLQLPKYHNFYVRRNGTGYFTGNSLAGPVVAASVILKDKRLYQIRDSKLLSEKEREKLSKKIKKEAKAISYGKVEVSEIERLGLQKAGLSALKRAFLNLRPKPDFVLIDFYKIPNLTVPQKSIKKGDLVCASIAAASILAKVFRDNLMRKLSKKYPGYNFSENKGYGTKKHKEALKKLGPCEIHRKNFGPVKKLT